jgi:hypothetical protein
MTAEEWRSIPGYAGQYEVSNLGRVRSLLVWRGVTPPRLLHAATNGAGYAVVHLGGGTQYVHSLVAEAFLGPRPVGHEVRHLDGSRTHNVLTNLAYGTSSRNPTSMRSRTGLTSTPARRTASADTSLTKPTRTAVRPVVANAVRAATTTRAAPRQPPPSTSPGPVSPMRNVLDRATTTTTQAEPRQSVGDVGGAPTEKDTR